MNKIRGSEQSGDKTAIRPFRVETPEEALTELRRRVKDLEFG